MNEQPTKKVAIIITSCDKFSDLWEPYFKLFWRNWSDCPFSVYLLTNDLKFYHPRVVTIAVGKDISWSDNLKKALVNIPEETILTLLEDAFIVKKVNNKKVLEVVNYFYEHELNYLRLRYDCRLKSSQVFLAEEVEKGAMWRTSIFSSIWKKNVLMDLLLTGENAWDFEIKGSMRSVKYDKFFSSTEDCFAYLHGVEKGRWIRSSVKKLRVIGLDIDTTKRPVMNLYETMRSKLGYVKQFILELFPVGKRQAVLLLINKFYKLFGLRGKEAVEAWKKE